MGKFKKLFLLFLVTCIASLLWQLPISKMLYFKAKIVYLTEFRDPVKVTLGYIKNAHKNPNESLSLITKLLFFQDLNLDIDKIEQNKISVYDYCNTTTDEQERNNCLIYNLALDKYDAFKFIQHYQLLKSLGVEQPSFQFIKYIDYLPLAIEYAQVSGIALNQILKQKEIDIIYDFYIIRRSELLESEGKINDQKEIEVIHKQLEVINKKIIEYSFYLSSKKI